MIIFDSSVWVALLHENDSQHKKAVHLFEEIHEGILLPEYVILEVYTVLMTRADKVHADGFLRHSTNNQNVHVLLSNESFFLDAVRTCQSQKHKGLSFTDTALALLSKEHTVITFDKLLQKALV